MGSAFTALEHIVVSACIAETDPAAAIETACTAVTGQFGPACRFARGHQHEGGPGEIVRSFGHASDGSGGTLVFGAQPELDASTLDRIVRLFEVLVATSEPTPAWMKSLHQLRNRLAGVLTNLEFVALVFEELPGCDERHLSADQRQQILSALDHARRSGRDMAEILRMMAGPT